MVLHQITHNVASSKAQPISQIYLKTPFVRICWVKKWMGKYAYISLSHA